VPAGPPAFFEAARLFGVRGAVFPGEGVSVETFSPAGSADADFSGSGLAAGRRLGARFFCGSDDVGSGFGSGAVGTGRFFGGMQLVVRMEV
jgi:hypothetical protein